MPSVKIMRGQVNASTPTNKAEIKGQGSIPYAQAKEEATPNTAKAKVTTGTKRGMGAALRGSRFTNA
mgnify:FL=1